MKTPVVKPDKKLIFWAPSGARETCQKVQLAKDSCPRLCQHQITAATPSVQPHSSLTYITGYVASCKQKASPAPSTHCAGGRKVDLQSKLVTLLHSTFVLTVGHVNPTDSHTSLGTGFRFGVCSHAGYRQKLFLTAFGGTTECTCH